jgi:general secretion pathway protein L
MLNEFLTWWASRMLELVPPALRDRSKGLPDGLVISADGAPKAGPVAIDIAVRQKGKLSPLGSFVLDTAGVQAASLALQKQRRQFAISLRVPAGVLLERLVVLPLAAEQDVANVLRYQIDLVTPFTSEELFWTWRIVRRDVERSRLHARLIFVPRAALSHLSAAAIRLGLAATVIEAPTAAGTPLAIPVEHRMTASERRQQRALRIGFGLTGALAAVVIILPFVLQSMAEARIDSQLEVLQPRLHLAEQLRARITSASAGAGLITAEQARVGDALAVLASVTAALPDDTSLTDLTLRQGKLELSGQSTAAAKLIAALSADPTIKNAAFVAPVTRADNGTDVFSIRADIVR